MKSQIEILKEALGDYKVSRTELLFHCPFCEHKNKKLSINLEKNMWKCWICDTRGKNISYLVKRFAPEYIDNWSLYDKSIITDNLEETVISILENKRYERDRTFEETKVSFPFQFKKFSKLSSVNERLAYNYLTKDRKLTAQDIMDYTIGYCEYGEYKGYVIIPSFNEDGKINNFIARTYTDNPIKYTGPPIKKNNVIFNEFYIDFTKPILLVEGFFDLVASGNDNCIPLLGSLLNKDSKLYHRLNEHKPEVTICLDKDAREKQQKILELLKDTIPELYFIDLEDDRDIAELGKEEFQILYQEKRERFTKEPLVNLEKKIRMIFE